MLNPEQSIVTRLPDTTFYNFRTSKFLGCINLNDGRILRLQNCPMFWLVLSCQYQSKKKLQKFKWAKKLSKQCPPFIYVNIRRTFFKLRQSPNTVCSTSETLISGLLRTKFVKHLVGSPVIS